MKIPEKIRTFCKSCGKHTIHKVSIYKPGKPRALSWGERQMARLRKGYGGKPRGRLRRKAKTTKKAVIVLKCGECGKKQMRCLGRLSKVEKAR